MLQADRLSRIPENVCKAGRKKRRDEKRPQDIAISELEKSGCSDPTEVANVRAKPLRVARREGMGRCDVKFLYRHRAFLARLCNKLFRAGISREDHAAQRRDADRRRGDIER